MYVHIAGFGHSGHGRDVPLHLGQRAVHDRPAADFTEIAELPNGYLLVVKDQVLAVHERASSQMASVLQAEGDVNKSAFMLIQRRG